MASRKHSLLVLSIFVAAVATACATIVSESEYPVTISSKPDGAQITITNRAGETVFSGKTPATVRLKAGAGFFKGENYTVTFKKPGYAPHAAEIKRRLDGWYVAGNLLIGGVIGWLIVDPATGAMWTLENLHVDLVPADAAKVSLRIMTLEDVPPHLRSSLVRVN